MGSADLEPIIIHTRRKTIALMITREGRLVVRAPLHTPRKKIDEIIAQKASWIQAKQKAARDRLAAVVPHHFSTGETFLYLGERYPLMWVEDARPLLALEGGRFHLSRAAQNQIPAVFTAWYRAAARQVLAERIAWYEVQMGLKAQHLKISSARSRWGSCSSRGTLSFPWRLVMAPLAVVDYVVVHELAHLREPNHSARFWACVESILPDYRVRLAWLKANGHLLNL